MSPGLEIENFLNAVLREYVMVPPYPFVEAQTPQQVAELTSYLATYDLIQHLRPRA